MDHPFNLEISNLKSLDIDSERQLTVDESTQIVGGRKSRWDHKSCDRKWEKKHKEHKKHRPDKPEFTTLALGEEGGVVTTLALGEEGGHC